MALCKNGLSAIRKIWNSITPALEATIEKVTEITGQIKALEANPTVQMIEKALANIPFFSEVKTFFDIALNTIIGAEATAKTIEEKISEWLNGKTTLDANKSLFALASTAVAVSDGMQKSESTYDSAVLLHIVSNKVGASTPIASKITFAAATPAPGLSETKADALPGETANHPFNNA